MLAITATSSLFFMQVMRMQTNYFGEQIIPGSNQVRDLHRGIYQHHLTLGRLLQEGISAAQRDRLQEDASAQTVAFNQGLTRLRGIVTSPEAVRLTENLGEHWEAYSALSDHIQKLVNEGRIEEAEQLLAGDAAGILFKVDEVMRGADRFVDNMVAAGIAHVSASQRRSLTISVALLLISFLIAGVVCTWFYRSLSARLELLRRTFSQVKDGDLTVTMPADGKDEIAVVARSFNELVGDLNSAFNAINQSMSRLHQSAASLNESFTGTADRARAQQSEMDAVATAMNEMAETIKEVARNADMAADSAREADKRAEEGGRVVGLTSTTIRQLNERVGEVSEHIGAVQDSSEAIGVVLGVIRGVAEQTNLLALNAAIEAARAGEQGRGFAVVADEVRVLASRTTESAQEIVQVIEGLQQRSEAAVKVAADAAIEAQEGVERADQASEALAAIVRAVSEIATMNTAIATSSEEQSAVAQEMDGNIVRIHDASQRTLQEADVARSESNTLNELANGVVRQLSRYKLRS
ncbi:hypothetical protein CAI21_19560 [Alkalilimnicola ehrlichii]|uniref:Methyl-accepting chemotaxis protein n=2 Tax=Alkalilimnicola ehrlichii TaxID=351052 RepID=A0A3E0WKD5_9GAMM|nr:hypothetical protein CAI21_19560 [Alkalilimnicola ehrlichii]RFA32426.1 hypothetical protein CAL65_19770 [Alkalilimnicola ehrlichii]